MQISLLLSLLLLITTISSSLACFSGDDLVRVLMMDQGQHHANDQNEEVFLITMQDLEIGDKVQVEGGGFEHVYSFAQYEPNHEASYLQLFAENATQGAFHVAPHQMIKIVSTTTGAHEYIPASSLEAGAELLMATADSEGDDSVTPTNMVSYVEVSTRVGSYCPLTESGTLLVNDVVASCYSTFQSDGVVVINSGVQLSSHWLQNKMSILHRLLPIVDMYDKDDGTNALLSAGDSLGQWWLSSHILVQLIVSMPLVVCVSVAWWIDTLIRMRALIVLTLFVGSLVARCRLCSGTEVELTI